jgi:hypothetical protein
MPWRAAAGIAFLVALAACKGSSSSSSGTSAAGDGGPPPPTRTGSCDRVPATGTCSEYDGAYLAKNEGLVTSTCAKLGGTFVWAECPNTSVVGACTLSTSEVRKFYGTGGAAYEPDRARTECERTFHGSWKAR